MYAYILETKRGFFEGVCERDSQTPNSQDPPPADSRIESRQC